MKKNKLDVYGYTTALKAAAWQTDEDFGYDHYRAAEFGCGKGNIPAIILLFDTKEKRDLWFKVTKKG